MKNSTHWPGTSEFLGVFLWGNLLEHSWNFLGYQETSGDPEKKIISHLTLHSESLAWRNIHRNRLSNLFSQILVSRSAGREPWPLSTLGWQQHDSYLLTHTGKGKLFLGSRDFLYDQLSFRMGGNMYTSKWKLCFQVRASLLHISQRSNWGRRWRLIY